LTITWYRGIIYEITVFKENRLTAPNTGSTTVVSFNCFTHEQVKEINEHIKKNILQKQDSEKPADNVSKIGEFFRVPCTPLIELLHPWLYQCQQANRDFFGYDIYWDFHLETMNYNVYGKDGKYDWHIDVDGINAFIDMKLTCLLNLSEEPYEGGICSLINHEKEIKFDSGMGLIFNSMTAHKVTPITTGERITLTYWGLGPPWK
jgi:predicted 2-oxoglutarate/Fe(II)-dependent dioxygenase YbiX